MSKVKCSALACELWGIAFITVLGSFFHFVFAWSGGWRPVALIAAVNESTWEHLKLAFWPALLYAIIEYGFLRRLVNNFWLAKSLGLLLMPLGIVGLFYGYTAVLGHHHLALDILIFVVAVAIGQLMSLKIFSVTDKGRTGAIFGAAVIVAMVAAFSLLTYYPPHNFLFKNPHTGRFGIP